MITVDDFLTKSSMNDFILIAGHSGVNKEIRAVSIMDAPDSYKWLKGGEFILTSGFLFGGDEWQIEHFIKNLINAGSSALGIKKGRFLSIIPDSIIEIANQAGFPIIEIPYHFGWSEIIASFYGAKTEEPVYETDTKKSPATTSKGQYYNKILLDIQTGKSAGNEPHNPSDFHIDEATIATGVVLVNSKDTDKIYSDIKKLLSSIRFIQMGKVNTYMKKMPEKSEALVLLELTPEKNESFEKWQFMFYNELGYNSNDANEDTVAIGSFYSGTKNINQSYNEAKEAYQVGKVLWEDKKCFSYPLLSAYSILRSADISKIDLSSLNILENNTEGLSFDAVKTIETYVECGNYRDSAKKLYIHENTLRYRINKIEEILHLDLTDAMVRNALIAQIKCKKLQSLV